MAAETASPLTDTDITTTAAAVRRFLSSRLRDPHQVDDVCQESIARVLRARDRLDAGSATAYAITVAKSLVVADARKADVARRHHHRLDRGAPPASPEDLAVQRSEAAAVTAALEALPADERDDLVAHVVEGEPTAALAGRSSGTPGGIAARLARTRARMRVEYLVAARGSTLPSERCHPVLVALSAGDRRRQRTLRSAEHLLDCAACSDLAPPLLERQRSLVGLVPIPALAPLLGKLRHRFDTWQLVAASSIVAVALVAAVVVGVNATQSSSRAAPAPTSPPSALPAPTAPASSAPPATAAPPAGSLLFDGQPAGGILRAGAAGGFATRPVTARGVVVESVPTDEGFWVDAGAARRMWVTLRVAGESPTDIVAGAVVSFDGDLVGHGPDYPAVVGLDPSEGAAELAAIGVHIEVDAADVRLGEA